MKEKIKRKTAQWRNQRQIARLARAVAKASPLDFSVPNAAKARPNKVVIFNVSARLTGLTLNAAFGLLTNWSLRLAGAQVKQFACQAGLTRCVLGTRVDNLEQPPPCASCMALTRRLNAGGELAWFDYQEDAALAAILADLNTAELSEFECTTSFLPTPAVLPLGKLVVTSIRWALRRHNLLDDAPTRQLMRQYILSAHSLARQFAEFLAVEKPDKVVIFNGVLYPEATARWVTRQLGIANYAYEVGFQPFSAFFTAGEPTAYPIAIPDDFELSDEQNARLDAHLEQRFQGKFTMAGIRFWREFHGLDESFLQKAAGFRQVVPVFTNVIYDTSQAHSNTIFSNMFEWLDTVEAIIRRHPETLFVIRAHPDEKRPNSRKISNESVEDWLHARGLEKLPNVVFIPPGEFISSYELIQRSKFVMVYNSSIGLEASIMGAAVICGGRARYTQYPTVFLPESADELAQLAEAFLDAEHVQAPPEFQRNARRFLYYQFYRVSIPFGDYIQEGERQGFVYLKAFPWQQLQPTGSTALATIVNGVLHGAPFLLPD